MSMVVKINIPNNRPSCYSLLPSINSVCLTCSENILLHKDWINIGLNSQENDSNSQILAEVLYGINSDVKSFLELNENENIYICNRCFLRIKLMSTWKKRLNSLQKQINKVVENLKLEEQIFKPGIERFLAAFYSTPVSRSTNSEKLSGVTEKTVHEIIPETFDDLHAETMDSHVIQELKAENLSDATPSQAPASINEQDEIQIKIETDMDMPSLSTFKPHKSLKVPEQENAENEVELNQETIESTKKFSDDDDSSTFEDMIMKCNSDKDWCYNSESQTDSDSVMSDDDRKICKLKKRDIVSRQTDPENQLNMESEGQQVSSQRKRKFSSSSDAVEDDCFGDSPKKNPRKNRKSYNAEFKLKVIEHVEKKTGSNKKTAAHFGIDESHVRGWRKQKDQICKSDKSRKRICDPADKVKDKKLEKEVIEWVNQQKKKGIIITAKALMTQALRLSTKPNFKASIGWAQRFMKRHALHNQRSASSEQAREAENNGENAQQKQILPSSSDNHFNNSPEKNAIEKRKSYNSDFKLKVIEHVEEITRCNRKTAAHFGINEKHVRDWRKQKDRIFNSDKATKRICDPADKVKDKKLEKELVEWVNQKKKEGIIVISAKALMMKALQLTTNPDFKASIGWAQRFMKRHELYNKK